MTTSKRSITAKTAAVVLTAVAGFVDAMGYLALLRIYTANMSGNSVSVGTDLARGQWRESARRFLPIATFFLGLLLAAILIETGRRWGLTRRVSLALSVELLCLLSFVPLARPISQPGASLHQPQDARGTALVAVAAVAMGAQNASLRETGALNVYTTHVTGTLTQLSDAAVKSVARLFTGPADHQRSAPSRLTFLTTLWLVYVAGAAAGGASWTCIGTSSMLFPAVLVAAVILLDLYHPLGKPPSTSPAEGHHA